MSGSAVWCKTTYIFISALKTRFVKNSEDESKVGRKFSYIYYKLLHGPVEISP